MFFKKTRWDRVFLGISLAVLALTVILTQNPSGWGQRFSGWLSQRVAVTSPETPQSILTTYEVLDEQSAVIKAVDEASPAVVSIVLKRVGFDPFSGPYSEESGIGTGFIIEADGLVLTNRHVVSVEDGDYTVVTKDKATYPVKEIHRDTVNDLALLRVEATNLPTVPLGDSDQLKVGQTVVAIGNALGRFSNTVTKGVVSGLGRGLVAQESFLGPAEQLENVIQTDAALNPGNSGGPLINLAGQVVGLNVAISQGAQNIGFAIPINSTKSVIEEFRQYGRIIRPFLGVEYVMIDSELATLRRLPEGAFIRRVVANSPASKAGLKTSDIITSFGGEKVSVDQSLASLIQKHGVGETVKIEVDRQGDALTLTVTLEERQD